MHKETHTRLPRSAFEPLKITAYLQCGVISDEYLPIDGVLYFEAMRQKYGEQYVTYAGSNHPNAAPGVSMPIARVNEEGPQWFYASSFAQWSSPVTSGQDHWNRRIDMSLIDLVDWAGRKARVDVASGQFKSYHMPVFYLHAISVSWYLLAHRQSVERLTAHVTNLGKKTSQGWGAVLRWELEPMSDDYSVTGPDERLMRAIPAETGILTGYRPSYWLPKNQCPCALPISILGQEGAPWIAEGGKK